MVREVRRDKWGMTTEDAIGDQLARFGITGYVEMDGESEGRVLPSGAEEGTGVGDASMTFVASDGNIYTIWLRWNPDKTAPDGSRGYYELESGDVSVSNGTGEKNFKWIPWIEGQQPPIEGKVDPASTEPYYIQSRKLLGLPVSEKQEEILEDFLMTNPNDHGIGRYVRSLKKTVTVLNQPPAKSDDN